ncbi:helix-turn-helix transcriptional regulator [Paractinoplanes hotanensis]|uniref:YafY family transcriptional regulator n=1 Tax=Paractinoplanes hotanensis TaxID=2906497 RepID=A0ABT0Y2D9_9ACTN|nr:YafY family protein [Actinoplanes hotanensis]MCM4080200.1 YafY family transcriptional regulator [Actinoplanes hotanensis]
MAHSASRVLAMLEILQAHRRMTVGDLAARLGVDERTVRRYATTLTDLGIPVTAERGRYGGYRLSPGFRLPPLMLTGDEAVAVVLGLIAARQIGLTAETPAAEAAEAKINRVLPADLADRLAALRSALGFTRAAAGSGQDSPASQILLVLGAATRAGERLTITYRESGDRDLDPYGLVFHSSRWYAVGLDHRSGEIRSFRADRIAAARPTGHHFDPPPGFDAVAHLNRQWARRGYRWQVEVLLQADLATVRRRIPASVAELTPADGGLLLTCQAEHLDGMAQMLAGLGHPFTVRAPAELRTAIERYAARLTEWARQGTI